MKDVLLVLTETTYCRDEKLIWLVGHFETTTFSAKIDRIICWHWLHCAKCTLQENERRGTEKSQSLSSQVSQRRVAAGRTFKFDRKTNK